MTTTISWPGAPAPPPAPGNPPPIGHVGVVGLGTAGARLARLFAARGVRTVCVADDDTRDLAAYRLDGTDEPLGADPGELANVDLVVEAAPDTLAAKRRALALIDRYACRNAPVITTAVDVAAGSFVDGSRNPSRVAVVRFCQPRLGKVAELVRRDRTDPDVAVRVAALLKAAGLHVLEVRDTGGVVVDDLILAMLDRAVAAVERGEATAEDLDAAMRHGCGFRDGPLRMLDAIGLETALAALWRLYRRPGRSDGAPALLLRRMVAGGLRGEASGRGFHRYQAAGSAELDTPARRSEVHRGVPRPVRGIGVVGSGTMATGIAEVFLRAGHPVLLVARTPDKAAAARAAVEASLRSGGVTGEVLADHMSRCRDASVLTTLADCDLVVEAVVEDLAVKQPLFTALDEVCRSDTILATSTSSLPVIECAMATSRPEEVVGMHFFNPAPVMGLVEVVPTVRTADDVLATALAVCHRVGKLPVECADRTGFLVNALLFPYLNDALRLVQDGIVDAGALDTALRAGCGFPVGPLRLVDVVGSDVTLTVLRRLRDELGRTELEPVGLLEALVASGHLGRKARRGVREYLRSGRSAQDGAA